MIKHGQVKGRDKQVPTGVHQPRWTVKEAKQVIIERHVKTAYGNMMERII
jgi:hypothetical protein